MSGVEVNKLILAALTTLLVVLLIGNVVNELSHREPLERNAYAVAVPDTDTGGEPAPTAPVAAAPELESVTPLLASADLAAGEKVARKRCSSCHTFNDGGSNKIGPNLWGVVGKQKAAADGFRYSNAIREKGSVWSYDDLNAFLAKPKNFIKRTLMNFPGFKSVEDRAAIIAYLRQQSDSPLPLPE